MIKLIKSFRIKRKSDPHKRAILKKVRHFRDQE